MSSPSSILRRPDRNPLAAPRGGNPVLADGLPGDRSRDFALAAGYALAVGLAGQAQAAPEAAAVPVTAQAVVVLLGAAVLGWRRALAGMVAYALLGLAGVPWFADRATGLLGAMQSLSFGYVLGFVVASMVVGGLAARGLDRDPLRAAGMLLAGLGIIYGFGLPWLMASLSVGPLRGVAEAVAPLLPIDLAGVVAGSLLLPAGRATLRRRGARTAR